MNDRVIKMARHNYTFCVEARNILDYSQLLRIYLVKNVAEALQMLQIVALCGAMVELVDTLVLGTSVARRVSSSLIRPTKLEAYNQKNSFSFFRKTVSANLSYVGWLRIKYALLGALHLGCFSPKCPLGNH